VVTVLRAVSGVAAGIAGGSAAERRVRRQPAPNRRQAGTAGRRPGRIIAGPPAGGLALSFRGRGAVVILARLLSVPGASPAPAAARKGVP